MINVSNALHFAVWCCRVTGQAVDTVGVAGKPKSITGFQTHSTPVLLAHMERAELANDDCMFRKRII